jgi:hypothetical protein
MLGFWESFVADPRGFFWLIMILDNYYELQVAIS